MQSRAILVRSIASSKILLSMSALLMAAVGSPASVACESLEACIALYPYTAAGARGIGPAEDDLARRVREFGPDAIPHLMGLLRHENAAVRQLAGYTIRNMDGLAPEHLEVLMWAMENGAGWIPPAIARIGTKEAIDFLVNDLRRHPEKNTQVTYAFRILGTRGASPVAELLACAHDCDEKVLDAAVFVLGELGEHAVAAIPRLLEIAGSDEFTLTSRRYATAAIGRIGASAEPKVPDLLALRRREPLLASAIDNALVEIGSSEAVASLLVSLPDHPMYVLRDIKSLGKNGYDAGPAVLDYLEDPDWDVRVIAADTLGRIGYGSASSTLARTLTDEDDWKLVYAASISLGRLNADEFIDELESVRSTHWYPPVRAIANSAIQHMQTGEGLDEADWWHFAPVENSPETCDAVSYRTVNEREGTKLYADHDHEHLKALSYLTSIYSYGAPEGTEPNEHGVIEVTAENMVEYVEPVLQVPDLALKVSNGWLVGSDRGEWGGELVHIPASGQRIVLYDGNVEEIFPLGSQIVATTGLAHLGMNSGFLLRIEEIESGRFSATPWKRLPGAPVSSWLIEGGELLVNTRGGGSIVVGSDGALRMAECLDGKQEDSHADHD